jgi:hypothetical protein
VGERGHGQCHAGGSGEALKCTPYEKSRSGRQLLQGALVDVVIVF